jgi:hypothetical protein
MLAGVAALAGVSAPSQAAFGDAANVFGKITNKSGVCWGCAQQGKQESKKWQPHGVDTQTSDQQARCSMPKSVG